MAIPGKFETTYRVLCMWCRKELDLKARSLDWTGDLRTELACATEGCTNVFDRKNQKTKGNVSLRPPVQLLELPGGSDVVLEEYECEEAEASHFCELFRDVLQRIPVPAKKAILAHWQSGKGSPHVWLLEDRREWKGRGWAATTTGGLGMCVVSTLVGRIPDQHIRTAIAHEFGHMLFISGNEPNHAPVEPSLESILAPPPHDSYTKLRPEWLVWRLMEAWGFDQPAMEAWMERNTIDDANGITVRQRPLTDEEFTGNCIVSRKQQEDVLQDMVFPPEFEKYRSG